MLNRVFIQRALASAALLVLMAAFGCGSEDDGRAPAAPGGAPAPKAVQRLFPTDRAYSIDDLKPLGMKVLNEYAVAEFPGALTAFHGSFNKIEYEARFYASHAEAVEKGAQPADEVSGPDAVVTGAEAKYQVGAAHRRLCSRAVESPHSGCAYSARYGDYVIKGNMVLLCEGIDGEQAMQACNDVLKSLPG